jgi:uncharacterized phage-associated protein
MIAPIRFEFRAAKFVAAVTYLAQACPGMTKLKLCKLLYFADKEHLVRFGRPITGDHYYKLEHGPVPTRGLDLLKGQGYAPDVALLEKYIAVKGMTIHPKQAPERKVFSRSDLGVLDSVCRKYGRMTAAQLRTLSHRERAWVEAAENGPMDFGLFFGDAPDAFQVKRLVEAEQESRSVILPFHASR